MHEVIKKMNEEEKIKRIKAKKNEIEKRIEEIKEEVREKYGVRYVAFKVYTPCGEIVADRYRLGDYASEYIHFYNNENYIAMVNIFAIEKIGTT